MFFLQCRKQASGPAARPVKLLAGGGSWARLVPRISTLFPRSPPQSPMKSREGCRGSNRGTGSRNNKTSYPPREDGLSWLIIRLRMSSEIITMHNKCAAMSLSGTDREMQWHYSITEREVMKQSLVYKCLLEVCINILINNYRRMTNVPPSSSVFISTSVACSDYISCVQEFGYNLNSAGCQIQFVPPLQSITAFIMAAITSNCPIFKELKIMTNPKMLVYKTKYLIYNRCRFLKCFITGGED